MVENIQERFEAWAAALEGSDPAGICGVREAWEDMQRRGLVAVEAGEVMVSPLAMRRATSDTQRRLAAHLSGYLLTENPFIVRRAGEPPGSATILNTRIAVEHIANYFNEGWGVTEIERELPVLTREEIEAAIQYFLNHRDEIARDVQRSRQIYETHAPSAPSPRETTPA